MAIYRADQAVVTFATEAAQGGIPEGASSVTDGTGTALINMADGLPAGSRSITVDALSGITAGEFIQIGPEINTGGGLAGVFRNSEIRTVEYVEGTTILHLDTPTAFFHLDNSGIAVVTATAETASDKFMTFIPGVYETVDVPDPEMAIEPRYLLGTSSKRNFYTQYKSSQAYSGSIGSFVLLNGWPLRFPIGKVTSIPSGGVADVTDLDGDHKKGDVWIKVDSAGSLAEGDLITIDYTGSPTASSICEIRRLVDVQSTVYFKLNYPLQFDHPAGSSSDQIKEITETTSGLYYQHDIFETVDLDTISWNVLMRDSGETEANDFIRRYFGGKVGSTTISASEEGMLSMSWDGLAFLGMNHNQMKSIYETSDSLLAETGFDSSETDVSVDDGTDFAVGDVIRIDDEDMLVTSISANVLTVERGYRGSTAVAHDDNAPIKVGLKTGGAAIVQTIDDTDMVGTVAANENSYALRDRSYPKTNPYFFSQGTISMFGTEFARIRDFSISIDNSIEPKYYINTRHGKLSRGPSETREGTRTYNMSATIALPDSVSATSSDSTLFKELLMEGDYAGANIASNKGFAITLTFTRGSNDTITMTIPSDGTAAEGGNESGAFITSATHNVGGSGALEVDASIIFRNMKIQIKDSVPLYP